MKRSMSLGQRVSVKDSNRRGTETGKRTTTRRKVRCRRRKVEGGTTLTREKGGSPDVRPVSGRRESETGCGDTVTVGKRDDGGGPRGTEDRR